MNPTLLGYLGFVVAALILIWAVLEISRRITRHKKIDTQIPNSWVALDSTRITATEEIHPSDTVEYIDEGDADDQPEESLHNMHTRAQQNGHYSESKKPL